MAAIDWCIMLGRTTSLAQEPSLGTPTRVSPGSRSRGDEARHLQKEGINFAGGNGLRVIIPSGDKEDSLTE